MDDAPKKRTATVSSGRSELGGLVDAAHYAGQHTVLTKNDQPRAVLVPYQWWLERQAQAG